MQSHKPQFTVAPLELGLRWAGGPFIYQEKIDGVFACEAIAGALLVGELLDHTFHAFDILASPDLGTIAGFPLARRLELLREFLQTPPPLKHQKFEAIKIVRQGNGGEFLQAILNEGGEGIVAKRADAPFGVDWIKCKRHEVFQAVVTDLDPMRGSASIAVGGTDAGWLAMRSRYDRVRLGSRLKVEAFGRHSSGKLREARLDRDTAESWLIQF